MAKPDKLWSGRFSKPTGLDMERFNASIGFDQRLYRVDIQGSRAYAEALERIGVFTPEERDKVVEGLLQVEQEIEVGQLSMTPDLEDIHTAVETRLFEIIGPLAGKLHTGRSRNDQVALDERLYLREAIAQTIDLIDRLQAGVLDSAEEHLDIVMAGYTHLQQGQPIRFSHYEMALFWMLDRDRGRFVDCGNRADAMPLGSGALAGSAYPLDREALASELGFSRITENSIDAVSDRDFILEYLSASAILLGHLSRFSEDLIIWSSSEFGFVALDEAYCTGSSMMPQKKNPDALELVRGKTGRVYGNLISLLTVMKGIPLTYAKDMQEDKEPLFDTVDTVCSVLEVVAGAWETLRVRPERINSQMDGMILATDLADYLARKGLPFRECHGIVGRLVRSASEMGKRLEELNLETLRTASDTFGPDVSDLLSPEKSTSRRELRGGTGKRAVTQQISEARRVLESRIQSE